MERDLNNDEFELFLKQKADQHKLFPSDKVWRGINNSLHPGMRWIKIGGSLLVVTALVFIFQETNFRGSSNLSVKHPSLSAAATAGTVTNKQTTITSFTTVSPKITNNKIDNPVAISSKPILSQAPVSSAVATAQENEPISDNDNLKGFILKNDEAVKQHLAINVTIPVNHVAVTDLEEKEPITEEKDLATSAVTTGTLSMEEERSVKDLNWLQEMAAIKLTPRKKSPFNLQFYFSPTISYRKLVDNQNTAYGAQQSVPVASSRDLNVNKYVDQNASIGAELGSNILFSATRNLTIKSGLQLNYSRYNIKAFKFYYEKTSIALNTAGPVPDTISSYTSLRNFNGYFPEQLQNQYLQVSVPIGAELKLLGNKRLQFNVAGTIQPTFLLFSDTYLLSSNYLNYTKEPSLVRRWNVHSSFEAFLSYKVGGLRWQLGPQFRYQLMSSYNDRYPIKEYLFEYGVKIGVSKTLR